MSDYPSPYTYPTAASPADGAESDTSGRHPVSVGHLVMGVAFLGLAAIWLLIETETVGNDDLRWFLPLPWLAAGLAGLLAVALTGRRSTGHGSASSAHVEPDPAWSEPAWSEPAQSEPAQSEPDVDGAIGVTDDRV